MEEHERLLLSIILLSFDDFMLKDAGPLLIQRRDLIRVSVACLEADFVPSLLTCRYHLHSV